MLRTLSHLAALFLLALGAQADTSRSCLSLAIANSDRGHESRVERALRLRPLVDAWRSLPTWTLAAHVALTWHESRWARYIWNGCRRIPPGAPDCDGGYARTVYQLHKRDAESVWRLPDGSEAQVTEAVAVAHRRLMWAYRLCQGKHPSGEDWQGAFSGYTGRGCKWRGGPNGTAARARTMRRVERCSLD